MEKNVGKRDRFIRIMLGLLLLLLAFGWKCLFCMVIALILLVTAGIGRCPLYKLLKINTCGVKK